MFSEVFFSYSVLFYLQKFKFTFIQTRCFVRNDYFSPEKSISVVKSNLRDAFINAEKINVKFYKSFS